MSSRKKISYKSSGVDIVLGEKLVETIKPLAKKTFRKEVINEIYNNSPLSGLLNKNDIIIEVQKRSIKSSSDLNRVVKNIISQKEQTLLLTVINNRNQRRYLGVKIK